jgi:hypothetical protein
MVAVIHNNVFDAALAYIATNAVEVEVQSAASVALVDGEVLNGSNFDAPSDNGSGGGGRCITCLVEDTGDMSNLVVDVAGSATKVALKNAGAAVLIEADITGAPVALLVTDLVNLGTFDVILKDPT